MVSDKVISIKTAKKPGKKKKVPPRLSKREAQDIINKIAQDSSCVFIPELGHADKRSELRDFTRNDIIEILREGIIRNEPILENGRWRYKLESIRFRGHPFGAAVVTIIREQNKDLLVVTVMWLDKH